VKNSLDVTTLPSRTKCSKPRKLFIPATTGPIIFFVKDQLFSAILVQPTLEGTTMAKPSKLALMSIEALMKLRDDVGAALAQKADELESQLSKLGASSAGNGRRGRRVSAMKGRKVPPKYRSKENLRLTWAGRGATPRWMSEEMKKRKLKKEAFLIK
jgi:DNA-binding protein H-NS